MSKIVNIYTGERLMTEGNALRHYTVKCKKALKTGCYDKMYEAWKETLSELNPDLCLYCSEDDIGYCGLRKSKISEQEKFMKYCFPSFVKALEKEAKF